MNWNPHEARLSARTMAYPNSQAERENIARVDSEVFDRVRVHEHQIVAAAQEFMRGESVHVEAAERLETGLRQRIRYRLEDGQAVDAAFAKEFEDFRRDAEAALAALERAQKQGAFHVARADDPYSAYMSLVEKYPMLNPRIAP